MKYSSSDLIFQYTREPLAECACLKKFPSGISSSRPNPFVAHRAFFTFAFCGVRYARRALKENPPTCSLEVSLVGHFFFFLLGFSLKGGLSVAFKSQWFMTKMESFPCLLTVEKDLGQISRCHNSDALLQDMREINFKSNKRTLASKVFYDGQVR